ncbi:hypothetical protein TorRG33x02_253280 [Trema orientale]|uniref:Uncharacterized protein n=1 Tax=Trema orientale TaxID=63057 RepID=A0A2P5DF61_TREOI|nr:hypothetical protein TorRG33x02_253280 [Trema orientale]
MKCLHCYNRNISVHDRIFLHDDIYMTIWKVKHMPHKQYSLVWKLYCFFHLKYE